MSVIDPKTSAAQTTKKPIFQPSNSWSRMMRTRKTSLYERMGLIEIYAASSGGPGRGRQPIAAVKLGRLGTGIAIAAAYGGSGHGPLPAK
jgi:hypothetical protein